MSQVDTNISWFIDRTGDRFINVIGSTSLNSITYFINSVDQLQGNIISSNDTSGNIMFNDLDFNKHIEISVDENLEITEEQRECCICMETKEKTDVCRINCGHTFCVKCCNESFHTKNRQGETMTCPLCRESVVSISVKNIESKDTFIKTNT